MEYHQDVHMEYHQDVHMEYHQDVHMEYHQDVQASFLCVVFSELDDPVRFTGSLNQS